MKRKFDDIETKFHRNPKKSNQNMKFQFGNYEKYYDNRNQDTRLIDFEKYSEYFLDKNCLDIGCNCGQLTVEFGNKYKVNHILGIDVDEKLIEMAKLSENEKTSFEYGNFNEFDFGNQKFDVILCLSVTKWIHLQHGDTGIKNTFEKINNLLNCGGLFVLEPQNWKSYKKKSNISEHIHDTMSKIEFFPSQFNTYLSETLGFQLIGKKHKETQLNTKFNREIYFYTKRSPIISL